MKIYRVNEIFYSLQGEGVRAGTANVFVRFSGCNLKCMRETHGFDCDTEFVSGVDMTAKEIVAQACDCVPMHTPGACCVIFTGGEPMLQLDRDLVSMFNGWHKAVETNGSRKVGQLGLDWVTVSPKVAEHAIRQRTANEVKYVRGSGQPIPKTAVVADHYLLSPAFDGMNYDPAAVAWCIKLVKENPQWRLSLQLHKLIGVR